MKWIFGITGLLSGGVMVFLLLRLNAVELAGNAFDVEMEPALTLPTYLSFVGVLLTVVTVVLAAVAIGIGVVAAHTFRDLRNRAISSAAEAVDNALSVDALDSRFRKFLDDNVAEAVDKTLFDEALDSRFRKFLDKRVAQYVKQRQSLTIGELEEEFDPKNIENR